MSWKKHYVAERQHNTNLLANVLYSIAVLIDTEEGSETQEPDGSMHVDSQARKYTNSPIDSDFKLWFNSRVNTGTVKGTIRH